MFSGIIESVQPIQSAVQEQELLRIRVRKPSEFNDIKTGDSIAVNGVCLTLEEQSAEEMQFALAAETLQVLQGMHNLNGQLVNLERSMRWGDRVHGHLVSGHVDSLGLVTKSIGEGGNWFLNVQVQPSLLPFIWKKGSIALNGTSLTINEVRGQEIEVCLIPETQKRTNLALLKVGQPVTIEADSMAKAIRRAVELSQ